MRTLVFTACEDLQIAREARQPLRVPGAMPAALGGHCDDPPVVRRRAGGRVAEPLPGITTA